MTKNKKTILITTLIAIILGSSIVFIGLFSYNKNIYIPKVENENISSNTIQLAKQITETNKLEELIETKKVNNKLENYFSTLLFEANIFSIIKEALILLDDKKIQIINFNQKIDYQILDDNRKIYCNLYLNHKKNSNIFYKSHLKFYILTN